jgi:hypothetical protein
LHLGAQEHKPHAIVVGASHPEARTLEQDLLAIRESILLDNPRFVIGGRGRTAGGPCLQARLCWLSGVGVGGRVCM